MLLWAPDSRPCNVALRDAALYRECDAAAKDPVAGGGGVLEARELYGHVRR